jgi:NADH dehydrogenase FAD-containing subunit
MSAMIREIDDHKVVIETETGPETIETHTVLWAAGMKVTLLCDRLAGHGGRSGPPGTDRGG